MRIPSSYEQNAAAAEENEQCTHTEKKKEKIHCKTSTRRTAKLARSSSSRSRWMWCVQMGNGGEGERKKMIVRVPSRPHESDYPWFRVFAPYNSESEFKPEEPAQCVERSQCDVICGGEIEWEKEKQKKKTTSTFAIIIITPRTISIEKGRGNGKKCEHHRRFHDSQTHDFHSQFHNFFSSLPQRSLRCFVFLFQLPLLCRRSMRRSAAMWRTMSSVLCYASP